MPKKIIFKDGQQIEVEVTNDDTVMKSRKVNFMVDRTSDTLTVGISITHRLGEPVPDTETILTVNGEEHSIALTDGAGTYTQACTDFDTFTLECEGESYEIPPITVITQEDRIAALEAMILELMATS